MIKQFKVMLHLLAFSQSSLAAQSLNIIQVLLTSAKILSMGVVWTNIRYSLGTLNGQKQYQVCSKLTRALFLGKSVAYKIYTFK